MRPIAPDLTFVIGIIAIGVAAISLGWSDALCVLYGAGCISVGLVTLRIVVGRLV
jgi:hypothetical protein